MAHSDWKDATPAAAAVACPAPMTREALIALRDAGALRTECPYIVTNHVQTRLVAGTTITMRAVANNELSERVEVNTTYDNEAWAGLYDIDRALVLELEDNRGNVAKGINGVEVANFDWGNAAYTDCLVDNASLTVTYGAAATMNRVKAISQGNLNVTGFVGTMIDVVVDRLAALNVTNANGTWRQSTWTNGQAFNATGYTGGGTAALNCTFDATPANFAGLTGPLNLVQADFENCQLNGAGPTIIAMARTTFRGMLFNRGAAGGAVNIFDCIAWGTPSIVVNGAGALTLAAQEIAGNVALSGTGALVMSNGSTLPTTNVNNGSSGLLNIQRSRVEGNGSYIQLDGGSSVTATITSATVMNSGGIRGIGAVSGALVVDAVSVQGGSVIYKRATGAQLRVANSTLVAGSAVDELGGSRSTNVTFSSLASAATITQTGTGAVTDAVSGIDAFNGALNIACSGASNTFTGYTRIAGNSSFTLNGTTGGQTITNCSVEANSTLTVSNTTLNMSLNQITVNQGSAFNVAGVNGAARTLQQMTVTEGSTVTITNSTVGGTIGRVIVRAGGQYIVNNLAGSADNVEVSRGTIAHTGGVLSSATKLMPGTLTTGVFNHANIVHANNSSQTLTAANTNRANYLGLVATAYTPTGQLI